VFLKVAANTSTITQVAVESTIKSSFIPYGRDAYDDSIMMNTETILGGAFIGSKT
jgi:hypothetical protein